MSALIPLVTADVGAGHRRLRALYPLISEEAPLVEIHVAMEGSWEGHASGPFELTRAAFAEIVRNFEASPNPIPLDFEHATAFAPEAPACGWVQRLEIRDDADGTAHLWAVAELGEKAAGYVKAGAYRFSSGVFEFGAVDPETGEDVGCVMSSLALTNVPFLRGQTPIQLSRRASSAAHSTRRIPLMKISKDALQAALDLLEGDEVSMAELEAAAQMAHAQSGELAEDAAPEEAPMMDGADDEEEHAAMDAGDEEDEEHPMSTPAAADAVPLMDEPEEDGEHAASMALAPLMEATGMDLAALTAALMENQDAVVSALSGALDAPAADAPLSDREATAALSARDTTIAALTAQVTTLSEWKAAREQADADRDVSILVSEGLITDDQRADFLAIRLDSRERFDRLAAGLRQVVPTGLHASGLRPPTEHTPSVQIDEADPYVVACRRQMGSVGIPRETQDEQIRRRLAAKRSQTRV